MKDNTPFELPAPSHHVAIVGQNGTGKSQAGAWLLSTRDLKAKPWIVIDYKYDELIGRIERAREIGLHDKIPTEPGVYVVHPTPEEDTETDNFLRRIWHSRDTGIWVDEGYLLPQGDKGPFQTLLTTGRSLGIPIVTLSQRPVRVSRFVFSEAKHVMAFDLTDRRDQEKLEELVPRGFCEWLPPEFEATGLPRYHSRWYNADLRKMFLMRPVPEAEKIVSDIDAQLEPRRRWL